MAQKSKSRITLWQTFLKLTLFLAVFWLPDPCFASLTIIDDADNSVCLDKSAKRVICLYGAFNEMLHAMDKASVIVARTNADTIPASIVNLPAIGTHMRPNVEMVVGMNPDLVLQMAGRKDAMASVRDLQQFGIQTAVFHPRTIEEMFSVIMRVAILVDGETAARKLISGYKKQLDHAAGLVKNSARKPRVFFEVRYPNLLGAGTQSIVNDIISKAGGQNCLEQNKKIVRVSEEKLISLAPEVYIMQKGPMNPRPCPLAARPLFTTLPATRNNKILIVDEQIFSRAGPRNIDAVFTLLSFLYPDKAAGKI